MATATPTKTTGRRRLTTTPPPEVTEDVKEVAKGVFEVPDEEEGSRVVEKAPRIPTPTISEQVDQIKDRATAVTDRVRKFGGQLTQRGSRKSGVKRPRTSVESLISTVWSIGARVMTPVAWPVANVLAMQSPVAGKILESTIKDTAADAILQPFARLAKGGELVTALLGPPVLVGVACARPDSRPIVEPLLREALKSWLTVAGPAFKERAEEEKKFQEEFGQTIDAMIAAIFTPPPGMVVEDDGSASGA